MIEAKVAYEGDKPWINREIYLRHFLACTATIFWDCSHSYFCTYGSFWSCSEIVPCRIRMHHCPHWGKSKTIMTVWTCVVDPWRIQSCTNWWGKGRCWEGQSLQAPPWLRIRCFQQALSRRPPHPETCGCNEWYRITIVEWYPVILHTFIPYTATSYRITCYTRKTKSASALSSSWTVWKHNLSLINVHAISIKVCVSR